jgi:hypothetical protein
MNEAEPSVPRWLQISIGLLLLPVTALCLIGAVLLVVKPPEKNPLLAVTIGSLMVLLSFWGLEKAVRLILGWRSRGGLMGPFALRVVGVFFLLLPLAGFFTDHYARYGLLAVIQAVGYVFTFFALLALARTRDKTYAQQGTHDDGPAPAGPAA